MANEFTFKVIKTYGIVSTNKSGWNKEVNLVSWAGREPKVDIREWSPDHTQMGKGITLTNEEVTELISVLNGINPSGL